MAIFDSNKVQNLTFYIVLNDAERVAELNAQFPRGINAAPYNPGPPEQGVSIEYEAPWMGLAAPGAHLPPYSYTDWPSSPSKPFPTNVATFQRHTGGFLGIGGTTTRYYWIGKFQYMPDANVGNVEAGVPAWAPTPKRLFVEGFECPARGVLLGNVGEYAITDASRHTGGRGLAIRGQTSASYTMLAGVYGVTPASALEQWDRFYIRLRKKPAATRNFWRYNTTPSAGVGHVLAITADGGLAVLESSSTSVLSLVTVIPGLQFEVWNGLADHDVWAKIDVVYKVGAGGTFKVYVNSVLKATVGTPSGPTGITSSTCGSPGQSPNDLELDMDDWSASDWPKKGGNFYVSKDFLNGTKIAAVRPRTFDSAVNWTGDVRVLGQNAFAFVPAELASSTSGALVSVNTDADEVIDNDAGAAGFGVAAIAVISYSKRGTVGSGSLGYKVGAAGAVDVAVTQPAALGSNGIVYSTQTAEDDDPFADVTPLLLRHTKAADASAGTIASLMAQVELVGKWSIADYRADELAALGQGPGAEHPPGVDTNGVLTDPQAYFFSLINRTSGSPANDWVTVLTASGIPPGLAPGVRPYDNGFYGLTQQVGADGVRGRLFLPTATADGLGYYSHPVDLLAGTDPNLTWLWQDLGGPAFAAVTPGGASHNMNYGTGPHNTPYPRTPWAKRGLSAPIGTYICVGGTYVGNGTGQDLTFKQPVHWLWIRPTSGSYGGGALWLSSALGGHTGHQQGIIPGVTFAEADPLFVPGDGENVLQFQFRVRLAGADQDLNAVGVTYQYIAVSDPSMRYLITGSLAHKSSETAIDNPLPVPDFTPEFLMLQAESQSSTTTKSLYLKGPAQAAGTLTNFSPAAPIAGLTFGTGKITSDAPLHAVTTSQSYAAWRRADGMQAPGQPGVVAIGNYTGDGSASRSINTAPASGKRPLFVLVYAETTSNGMTRDPSHTGTTSSTHTGAANASTGITTGNVDGFSVGSALNSNGVNYGYFVLFANGTACNNGFGCNGEYIPVEPETPTNGGGGAWPPNPGPPLAPGGGEEAPPAGGTGQGGPPIDSPDFSTACFAWSTWLTNMALSRIGISHQIADLRTEVSEPAYKARLVYSNDMERTLRDFPWPFATRYADLVLVAGTATVPVNKDWQYAYRAPVDMVTARRLVNQDGKQRSYDPAPPRYRIGSDATGTLIYSNEAATVDRPLALEFTYRVQCPASMADPLFRDAITWKLAASLALILAKDRKKAEECELLYRDVLVAAKEVAANEDQKDPDNGDAPWIRDRG